MQTFPDLSNGEKAGRVAGYAVNTLLALSFSLPFIALFALFWTNR